MKKLEESIEQKALALGYEKCGIVRVGELAGYDGMLAERVKNVPAAAMFYENQKRLTHIEEQYPWAKSVVVAVRTFKNYRVPEEVDGHVGKHYLFDARVDSGSGDYQRSTEMDEFLRELGLKTASERKFGLVGLRWAAMKAGLGLVRRNNFFYTESGSWVSLEAWITDGDMELLHSCTLPPCPDGCRKCQEACPTKSLSAPFTMSPVTCVSFMTTFGMNDLSKHPLARQTGSWVYGCDACQDACPMNRGKWAGDREYPGLGDLAVLLSPEKILELDETTYREKVQPRFFYLKPEELWKWKVNTLNYMRNNYRKEYKENILNAVHDENEKVRAMAACVAESFFRLDA